MYQGLAFFCSSSQVVEKFDWLSKLFYTVVFFVLIYLGSIKRHILKMPSIEPRAAWCEDRKLLLCQTFEPLFKFKNFNLFKKQFKKAIKSPAQVILNKFRCFAFLRLLTKIDHMNESLEGNVPLSAALDLEKTDGPQIFEQRLMVSEFLQPGGFV